jgi:hypothetical protein
MKVVVLMFTKLIATFLWSFFMFLCDFNSDKIWLMSIWGTFWIPQVCCCQLIDFNWNWKLLCWCLLNLLRTSYDNSSCFYATLVQTTFDQYQFWGTFCLFGDLLKLKVAVLMFTKLIPNFLWLFLVFYATLVPIRFAWNYFQEIFEHLKSVSAILVSQNEICCVFIQ